MSLYEKFKKLIEKSDIKIIWSNLDKVGHLKVCLLYNGQEVIGQVVEEDGKIILK